MLVIFGHSFPRLVPWFWGSMEVFFCISGFLITRILLAHRGEATLLPYFFVRRMLRTWPMYFVAMLFAFAVIYVGGKAAGQPLSGWEPTWYVVVLPLVFMQNMESLFGAAFAFLPGFEHSWSVSVEEQYYVLWALVLFFARSSLSIRAMLAFTFSSIVLSILFQAGGGHHLLLMSRLYGFALGALLAGLEMRAAIDPILRERMRGIFSFAWILPCALLSPFIFMSYGYVSLGTDNVLARLLLVSVLNPYLNFAVLAFCLLGVLIFCFWPRLSWMLKSRVLTHLGAISYSTYLLHLPIVLSLAPYLDRRYGLGHTTAALVGILLSLMLSHLSYHLVELRAMKLKRLFPYSKLGPAPIPPGVETGH
jgi:peptidoglycan/LPS O-acetylase OafA/YrhL